ncbi:MAG: ABC transporter ATP-binding protein, partial [Gemmatimonadota bacterium]
MSQLAIGARDIAKKYRIGGPAQRHASLRDAIVHTAGAPLRGMRSLMRSNDARQTAREAEEFFALKGVSFDIKQGEV